MEMCQWCGTLCQCQCASVCSKIRPIHAEDLHILLFKKSLRCFEHFLDTSTYLQPEARIRECTVGYR